MERQDTVPVVDDWGEVLFFAGDEAARELLNARKATMQSVGGLRLLRVNTRKPPKPNHTADWAFGQHTPSPFDIVAGRERCEVLEQCKAKLSGRNRQLLRLRYWNELTFAEASAALGVTQPAAVTMHDRVLEKIAGHLRSLGIVRLEQI